MPDASTILPASLLDQAEIIGQAGSGPGTSLATPLTVFADHGAERSGSQWRSCCGLATPARIRPLTLLLRLLMLK
jgi:hypothetical protein